jgi:hypothetical protein
MPRIVFEPTTPVLDRSNTVHVLDRVAAVIGSETAQSVLFRNKTLPALWTSHNFQGSRHIEIRWDGFVLRMGQERFKWSFGSESA